MLRIELGKSATEVRRVVLLLGLVLVLFTLVLMLLSWRVLLFMEAE